MYYLQFLTFSSNSQGQWIHRAIFEKEFKYIHNLERWLDIFNCPKKLYQDKSFIKPTFIEYIHKDSKYIAIIVKC